jgi:DNA-binding Lrp family transcriptional regulator
LEKDLALNFENRIKKEMSEGIVKAILEDAHYRVIDSGIEKVLRELSCLPNLEYAQLAYPEAMSRLPDFTVMDRSQSKKFLVEVKYRNSWSVDLLHEVARQVEIFGELVLVCINATPDNPRQLVMAPTYLRCCRLRHSEGQTLVELMSPEKSLYWKAIEHVGSKTPWWATLPLEMVFTDLAKDVGNREALHAAIRALSGILTLPETS